MRRGITVSQGTTLTVGTLTPYTFTEQIVSGTMAFGVTGFAATVADFVTLSGDLGFKKSGGDHHCGRWSVTAALAAGRGRT